MLNIRTFILSVALAAIFVLTAGLVTARTENISHTSSSPASVSEVQERPAEKDDTHRAPSYRSQYGECYDVPISELAACRKASQKAAQMLDLAVDECFDVSLWEVASCRKADQASAP